MFQQRYARFFSRIQPGPDLERRLLRQVRLRRTAPARARRAAGALAAACLCLALALPAAAASDAAYPVLYALSPAAAQLFRPVRMADEDGGIRMEVESVRIQGDTAEIFLTLQDLTGDRVDGTTDLYDSYRIHRAFDSAASCRLEGFDPQTGTARFLIKIQAMDGREISGDKITFSLGGFLSRRQDFEGVEIPLDLSALPDRPDSRPEGLLTGGGGLGYRQYVGDRREVTVLTPGPALEGFPVEGIDLTAAGVLDGMLHVQMAVEDPLDNDNHGFFCLVDEAGNRVQPLYSVSFVNQFETPGRIGYTEDVFDVPWEQLGRYRLSGDFYVTGLHTQGSWSVTFPLA